MSDYFSTMEQEFYKITASIDRKLATVASLANERKESAVNDAQRELNDAESCIKQMEIEVNPLPERDKKDLQQKIRRCRQEFEEARRKFHSAEEALMINKQKQNLMGNRGQNEGQDRFLAPDSLLTAQNARLQESKKTAFDTLDVASNIQNNLKGQSDTMRRNINRLGETNDELSWSNKLIDKMNRRMRQNRILMWVVFSIIALACIGIVISYLI